MEKAVIKINFTRINALPLIQSQSRFYSAASRHSEQASIKIYSRIFTQLGNKVLVHACILNGKKPEKRMTFIKVYIYANYLIGNKTVSIGDLAKVCCKKKHKVRSDNLKASLSSKKNQGFFTISKSEDGINHVGLTNQGMKDSHYLTEELNALDPQDPTRRKKDMLIIFKEKGLIVKNNPISVKALKKICTEYEYNVRSDNLRSLLSARFAQHYFVINDKIDTVHLSPPGLEVAKKIKGDASNIIPLPV